MKARSIVEVVLVFTLTLTLITLVSLSPLGAWERQVTRYPYLEYLVMIGLPLLVLLVTRRNLAPYGLSVRHLRYHLDIAATTIIPVALASAALGLVNHTHWTGALIISGVHIVLLVLVAWLLKRKPTHGEPGVLVGAILLLTGATLTQRPTMVRVVSAFVFYIFFLGLGEELLFRGYIQSRLNVAWGKPFQFYGVRWGWGLVIASLLFGLMHVLNLGSLVGGDWQPEWGWGLWTFFSGLVLGFVREKTGSIVAPAILHGLPDAIAASLGLL
jgi:hypothetical protein